MMNLSERVRRLIEVAATELGLELVLLEVTPSRRVRCIIDREPGGVTLGDCTALSRTVTAALNRNDLDAGAFHVEVMSPGVNRLLVRDQDFVRFRHRLVRVTLTRKVNDRRNFSGVLEGLRGDAVVLRLDPGSEAAVFPRDRIKEVRLIPEPS